MIELHRLLLTYLLNSIWQVPLLVLIAFLCAFILRKTSVSIQHRLWVATLALSILLPVASTSGWFISLFGSPAGRMHAKTTSTITLLLNGEPQAGALQAHPNPLLAAVNPANLLLLVWLGFVLYRISSIVWSWYRTQSLVRNSRATAFAPALDRQWKAAESYFRLPATLILHSDQIPTPAVLGVRNPVMLLPASLFSQASETEWAAIFAHESAHIHRRDFLLNLLYELLAIPVAYNPATFLLRSRIANSRELICDQLAAESLGNSTGYARSLVHIAESISNSIPAPIHALGIFEGRNLEQRVMSLLNRTPRLSRNATAIAVVFCSVIFGSCCLAASAFNFQPAAIVSSELQPFAGTWNWMFKGKPFIAMTLVPAGDHFTGSMTNGFFTDDASGNMTDAGSEPGTSLVLRSFFAGKVLHIIVQDDRDKSLSEWTMTLLGPDKAQFDTADPSRPKNLKPWIAERAAEKAFSTPALNSGSVYHIGAGVSAPVLISSAQPEFPSGHHEKNFSGTCLVSLVVDASGSAQQVKIVRPLSPDFDQSALHAVQQYKFKPAMFKGKPVPVSLKVEVKFTRF